MADYSREELEALYETHKETIYAFSKEANDMKLVFELTAYPSGQIHFTVRNIEENERNFMKRIIFNNGSKGYEEYYYKEK